MPFSHGKDTKVYVSGYDLTTYFNNFVTSMNADLADTSTFGNVYKSFVAGLIESTMSMEGYYDGSANAVDAVLGAALGGDVYLVQLPQGDVQGARGRAMYGVETTYDVTTGIDGAASISAEAQSKAGSEAVVVNTIKGARGTTGSDTVGVDSGIVGGTNNSWAAFLHVFAGSGAGGTLDVRLQDSTDGSAWLDVTGGAFSQVLVAGVPTAKRIQGASGAALRRWTKFAWTIAGTGPSFTFWAGHVRK